jgi:hypothetical protein
LPGSASTSEALRRLESILRSHPGNAPVRLHLTLPDGRRVSIAPSASFSVTPDETLRMALETEFGAGCVTFK